MFIEIFVVLALHLAVAFGRDHGFGSHGFNVFYDGVGIVALVGKHGLGLMRASNAMAWVQSFTWPPVIRKSKGMPSSSVRCAFQKATKSLAVTHCELGVNVDLDWG